MNRSSDSRTVRRRLRSLRLAAAVGALTAGVSPAAPVSAAQAQVDAPSRSSAARGRFTAPLQPWASPAGDVHLLRPATVRPTADAAALGALMAPGWRMVWDGSPSTPGRMIVRLLLKVAPIAPQTSAIEGLQVGVSRARASLRKCLADGLMGASGRRGPDRIINGRRYAVWINSAAGMSQSVAATDLRTVVHGVCYAVERFRYGGGADDPDPSVTLPQAQGAAELDASLSSLQIGPLGAGTILWAPRVATAPNTVVR